VNGVFFVFNLEIFNYLDEDSILEGAPLKQIARERQLIAFPHTGFWKFMDTNKDNIEFNQLWKEIPAWKVWDN
jgi:glucose-1-phosphate cytidylyltransferase